MRGAAADHTGRSAASSFKVNAESGILVEANTAFALGIVMTELVTNAVKYAFPPPRSGTIFAETRIGEPERVEVSIRDDGIGMASFREGSLGYGLVRSLVEQIQRHHRRAKRSRLGCNNLFSGSIGQSLEAGAHAAEWLKPRQPGGFPLARLSDLSRLFTMMQRS